MKPVLNSIQLTSTQLNYSENPLWERISGYQIDRPDAALPFSRKLGQTEGWTRRFCLLAIEEYKRFVYLCCVSENGASPSMMVDKVWHMHLLYTTEYWKEFCPDILERELHHFPSLGGVTAFNKHQDWYLETLKLYITVFEQNPPKDFWKIPEQIIPFLLPEENTGRNDVRQTGWKKIIRNLISKIFT